ncbi:MAG: RNA methyltransferase [candidate division KSB1 bacterium]|nr:RNA methyltransferase [candidate division KSB1 bacterium]
MIQVARARLGNLIVVEDRIEDPHNLSATLRTCEILGVQRVLVLDPERVFSLNPRVSVEAHRWLTIERYCDYDAGLARLRELAGKIYVTSLRPDAFSIHELFPLFPWPFRWPPVPSREKRAQQEQPEGRPVGIPPPTPDPQEPFATVFGNEVDGVSEALQRLATAHFYVPTPGFVQSFNVSVAVGIVLYHVTSWLRLQLGKEGTLAQGEVEQLVETWLARDRKRGGVSHS